MKEWNSFFEHWSRSFRHSTAITLSKFEHRAPFANNKLHVMTIMRIVQCNISCLAAYNYERRHGSAAVSAISIFRIVVYTFSLSLLFLFVPLSFTPPSFCAVRGHCYREGIDANPWQRSDARDRRAGSTENVSASLILAAPLAFMNR